LNLPSRGPLFPAWYISKMTLDGIVLLIAAATAHSATSARLTSPLIVSPLINDDNDDNSDNEY